MVAVAGLTVTLVKTGVCVTEAINEYVLVPDPGKVSVEPTVGAADDAAVHMADDPVLSKGIVPVESKCTPRFHPACTGTGLAGVNVFTPITEGVIDGETYCTTFEPLTSTNSNGFKLEAL